MSEERGKDELYDQAKEIFVNAGTISIFLLQRKLGTGYNRSWHIVEYMVRDGFIRPTGNKYGEGPLYKLCKP